MTDPHGFPQYLPGRQRLSEMQRVEEIAARIDHARWQPGEGETSTGGASVFDTAPRSFPAKITGRYSSDHTRYDFVEVMVTAGTTVVPGDGFPDTAATYTAYEINGNTEVPTNAIVRMYSAEDDDNTFYFEYDKGGLTAGDVTFTGSVYFTGNIDIDNGAITYNASTNTWTYNAVTLNLASSSTINLSGYVLYEGNTYYNPTTNTFTYYSGSTLAINSSSITVGGSSTYTYAAGSVLNLNGDVYIENNKWYDYTTNTFNYWSGSNLTINSSSITVGGSSTTTFSGPVTLNNYLYLSNNSSVSLSGTVYTVGTATLNIAAGITTLYYGCFQSYGCFYLNGCYHIIPQGTDTTSFTTGGGTVEPDVPDYPWLFWTPTGDTTVPGFTGYADGKVFELTNDSTSKNITVTNEDGGVTAAHRIRTPNQANYVIGPRSSAYFAYRAGSTNRWYVLDKLQAAGSGTSAGTDGQVQTSDGVGGFVAADGVTWNGSGSAAPTLQVVGQETGYTALALDSYGASNSETALTITTGKINLGGSTATPIGLHGATAVAQRAGAAQAAVSTTAATNSSPYGFTTAAQADAIVTLLNELRAALVEKGIIKGSA